MERLNVSTQAIIAPHLFNEIRYKCTWGRAEEREARMPVRR